MRPTNLTATPSPTTIALASDAPSSFPSHAPVTAVSTRPPRITMAPSPTVTALPLTSPGPTFFPIQVPVTTAPVLTMPPSMDNSNSQPTLGPALPPLPANKTSRPAPLAPAPLASAPIAPAPLASAPTRPVSNTTTMVQQTNLSSTGSSNRMLSVGRWWV